MSIMNAELYDALKEAGASEEKARVAACSVGDVNQLATKGDIASLRSEMKAGMESVKSDILKWMFGSMIAQTAIVTSIIIKLT